MKKTLTFLFAMVLAVTAFAQIAPNQNRNNGRLPLNPQNIRPIERREPIRVPPQPLPGFGNQNRMPIFNQPPPTQRDDHRPRDRDADRNRDRNRDWNRGRDRWDRNDWDQCRRNSYLSVRFPMNISLIFPVEVTRTYSETWDFYTPYGEFHNGFYYESIMLEDRMFYLDFYRPMFGYTVDWVREHRYQAAPRYSRPRWDCYRGYFWYTQPDSFYLVWVWNSNYQSYYPAYYYPEYGYYAWASEPLLAVGEYNPQFSIVIILR